MSYIRKTGALSLVFLLMTALLWSVYPQTTAHAAGEYEGKTVILHSNDVHGMIDGYAKIAALKKEYESKGAEVILTDAGDFSQGSLYVNTYNGASAVELMNACGYEVVTPGDHEFDYGMDQLRSNLSKASFHMICANIFENGTSVFDPVYIHTTKDGVKIGFLGLSTPESRTKVHPGKIKGISFLDGSDLYAAAVQQTERLKSEGADIIIALAHLGIDAESATGGNRSVDVYAHSDIDVILDGHSHSVMTNADNGEPVLSTGTKFENIGVVIIDNASKKIESRSLVPTEGLASDDTVKALSDSIQAKVDNEYSQTFAKSEVELDGTKEGNRAHETNSGDLITDAMRWSILRDPSSLLVDAAHTVAIENGGGIRAAISPGDVTKKDLGSVLPFGNTLSVVYVTGNELLEILEASTFILPDTLGGFPQTCGIRFTVDTTKPYDQGKAYPDSTYYAPASIKRVSISSINGEAFSPADTYAVITNDFCAAGGDTYYALRSAKNRFDTGRFLDEVVIEYIQSELSGVISAARYGSTRGDLTIITAPAASEGSDTVSQEEGTPSDGYTVAKGDTLCSIARKLYGDGNKWKLIFDANRDIISDPNIIYPGRKLKLPDAA